MRYYEIEFQVNDGAPNRVPVEFSTQFYSQEEVIRIARKVWDDFNMESPEESKVLWNAWLHYIANVLDNTDDYTNENLAEPLHALSMFLGGNGSSVPIIEDAEGDAPAEPPRKKVRIIEEGS